MGRRGVRRSARDPALAVPSDREAGARVRPTTARRAPADVRDPRDPRARRPQALAPAAAQPDGAHAEGNVPVRALGRRVSRPLLPVEAASATGRRAWAI